MNYVTVKQAAAELQVSISTIYRRVRAGLLTNERQGQRIMIHIENASKAQETTSPSAVSSSPTAPTTATANNGAGQRELVPRQSPRMVFLQAFNWR